jgi:hypothetical protein
MCNPTPRIGTQIPEVCLSRSGGSEPCGCVRLESRGAVFNMPRRLDLMSDIVLSIEWPSAGCARRTMHIEAIVIGCRETESGGFEMTVIFLPGCELCVPEFRHLPN